MQGLILGLCDHDPSQRWTLNQLTHPGTPYHTLFKKKVTFLLQVRTNKHESDQCMGKQIIFPFSQMCKQASLIHCSQKYGLTAS